MNEMHYLEERAVGARDGANRLRTHALELLVPKIPKFL